MEMSGDEAKEVSSEIDGGRTGEAVADNEDRKARSARDYTREPAIAFG